jgi:hypothetical protein
MTLDPAGDLARHVRFQADFSDGTTDAFAIPKGTLQQGDAPSVLRTVAHEWQRDGLTRPQESELSRDPAAIATASASHSQFSSENFCPNMAWTSQGSPA